MMSTHYPSNRIMRIIVLVSVGLSLLATLGCEKQKPVDVKIIGILCFGDSRKPQADGFVAEMARMGYADDKKTKFITLNAKNDRSRLKPLVQELIDKDVSLLVAAGGLEADTMKKMVEGKNIPVVVLYVNAIVERGLVESRREAGWDVTGVDNLNAELSGKRIELMHDLLPDMKKILVLCYDRIAPSRIGVEKAREMANKSQLIIDARAVNSRDDIKHVMESLKPGEVDAMLTVPTAPIDNALQDLILPHVNRLKLPLMTHSKPLAEKGALASYGAHFYEMGQQSARLADKIMKGIDASNIPFETPKNIVYTMNEDVRKEYSIQINELVRNQINEYIKMNK